MKKIVLLGAITAWLLLPVAWGEEEQKGTDVRGDYKGQPPGRKDNWKQELLKRFDKDGDGKLSEEEMAEAKAAREEKIKAEMAERFKKIDADGNGCISLEEWTEFHMKQREMVKGKMRGEGDGKECHPKRGNNGVGNGEDPAPPGNPPENDGPGTGPGNPGNQGGI